MHPDGDGFVAEVTVPSTGGLGWFCEAVFTGSSGSYTLSTPPGIAPEPRVSAGEKVSQR